MGAASTAMFALRRAVYLISAQVRLLIAVSLVCGLLGQSFAADGFIEARGGRLHLEGKEFRFVSWNIPNLHLVEDNFEFLGTSSWRWPDEFEINDALESVRQMGGTVVRPYVISVRRDDGDMGQHVHVTGPGQFNEAGFRALDQVLKIAAEKNVRVILPLVDNWKWWGGVEQYAAFRGKTSAEFWTDRQLIDDFKQTIRFIVNRKNTLTGRLYRDDPAIFGWETGNELDAPPQWTREIAALLKELDPNHLVIDGRSLHGVTPESLRDPNVDVLTTHHYPNTGNNNAESVIAAIRQIDGKKPYFVGEFGFIPVPEAKRILQTVIDRNVSGALYWSLRPHRREGGFYWHHEPSGGDLFKAYHWPGFPSGTEYRENLVLPMVRQAAFKIRGLQVPPMPIPSPPKLLPVDDPARISWQGSTGASSYDVQRATSQQGPWKTVGTDVSDAAVQYRPLYNDKSVRVGSSLFYRIIAKNQSGTSAPSNIVGPVIAKHRTLVDEMQEQDSLHQASGPAEYRTGYARKVQEDIHRLHLAAGGTVQYDLPHSILRIRVWAFAKSADANLMLKTIAADGQQHEVSLQKTLSKRDAGDYGYLTPILFESSSIPATCRKLQLSVPNSDADAGIEISRIEIRNAGTLNP